MKKATIALLLICGAVFAQQKGSYTDTRDKKIYKTVKIGEQTWMAENLNHDAKDSKCYDNKPDNCIKYGRLYDWNTALKVCPSGWHLPNRDEWKKLMDFTGGEETAGNKLKAKKGWADKGNGTDSYGFSALPGGNGDSDGSFGNVGCNGHWWSASEFGNSHAYYWNMNCNGGSAGRRSLNKTYLYSVRCLQDPSSSSIGGGSSSSTTPTISSSSSSDMSNSSGAPLSETTFKDSRDGQTYKSVKIGTQTWMAENLNYDAKDSKCYDNKPDNCVKYGRLYDWATAMDLPSSCNENSCSSQVQAKHRGICPSGWHIPSYDDWDVLLNQVGGYETAGKHLKSRNGWESYSGIENLDTYGFSALPGGDGRSDGSFGNVGLWWSANENSSYGAYPQLMFYNGDDAFRYSIYKDNLYSVRCLQD
ncbi:MAG: fibrobacter succinogenes major paralogous domain-containing protein [Candidatus Fibromonas sp.]|nr:fibrobacter succinogenes major paralogous domain-containing protein [Candidatus Fibromonas sp.]